MPTCDTAYAKSFSTNQQSRIRCADTSYRICQCEEAPKLRRRFVTLNTLPACGRSAIDSVGFRDDLWIDWDGSVITEAAKVRERIRRPDFGHLDIEITVDDPKACAKPWMVMVHQQFAGETELIDEICAEGQRFSKTLR